MGPVHRAQQARRLLCDRWVGENTAILFLVVFPAASKHLTPPAYSAKITDAPSPPPSPPFPPQIPPLRVFFPLLSPTPSHQDVETANQQTVGMALPAGVNFAHIWTAMMHHMKHNPILQEEIAKHDSFVEMANKAYAGKADMKMMESIFASDGIDLKTGRDLAAKGPKGGAKPSSGKSSAASGAGSGKVPEGDA